MGTWGDGIFQNDDAKDVRTLTLKLLGDGLDGEEVANDVRAKLPGLFEPGEGAAVLALSLTLHSRGFLEPTLRQAAIRQIEDEMAAGPIPARRKHLERALPTLQGEQKKPSRPKKRIPYLAPYLPGDFLAVETGDGPEALVYVTGRTGISIAGDRSNTVRVLGPMNPSFDPAVAPDVPHLGGQEFERPQRYLHLLLTQPPEGVRVVGRFFPVPNHQPEQLQNFLAEQAAKGNLTLPDPEDGHPTAGPVVSWDRFLAAVREVVE